MKYACFVFSCFAFVSYTSCNSSGPSPNQQEEVNSKETLSLTAYVDSLKTLDTNKAGTVDQALRLLDRLTPADSTGSDSAAAALMGFISEVATRENDRLWQDTADYSALVDADASTLTEKQKAVQSDLRQNGLKPVGDGEGGIYLVPVYESIVPVIKRKTSKAVGSYLDLVAKDDIMPVFLDAGLAIELSEVVNRLVLSEQLLGQQLPQRFQTEAARLNELYTNALVNGADNSPSMEQGSKVFNPEFKTAYEYLLANYPSTKAAAKIREWMAVVASGDQAKIDAYRQTPD